MGAMNVVAMSPDIDVLELSVDINASLVDAEIFGFGADQTRALEKAREICDALAAVRSSEEQPRAAIGAQYAVGLASSSTAEDEERWASIVRDAGRVRHLVDQILGSPETHASEMSDVAAYFQSLSRFLLTFAS
jgi:hypothetical protein